MQFFFLTYRHSPKNINCLFSTNPEFIKIQISVRTLRLFLAVFQKKSVEFEAGRTRRQKFWDHVYLRHLSAKCRSPYRPKVSTDTRPRDALSTHGTHDPNFVSSAEFQEKFWFNKFLLQNFC